jgi:hypothetical protein
MGATWRVAECELRDRVLDRRVSGGGLQGAGTSSHAAPPAHRV